MSQTARVGLLVAYWGSCGLVLYWCQYSYAWWVVEPRTMQERLVGWSLPADKLLKQHRSFAYDSSGVDEWEFRLDTDEIKELTGKCLRRDPEGADARLSSTGREAECYLADVTDENRKVNESVAIVGDKLRVMRIVE